MKHVPPPQGEPLNASILPSDITAQDLPVVIGRLRKEARDEIHRLIGFLDTTDDYVSRELEDQVDDGPCDTDELEMGWTGVTAGSANMPNESWIDEGEADGGGGDANDEPSLAGTVATDQSHWNSGNDDDREGDGCADDRESDELQHGGEAVREDDEPSLGWTPTEAARGRAYAGAFGQSVDLEDQCEDEGDRSDSGIADADGLQEQIGQSEGFSYREVL
jgi:hypothetical protein